MRKLTSAVALIALIVVSGCVGPAADSGRIAGPRGRAPSADVVTMGTCTTLAYLDTLANEVFGAGSPNVQSVIGKLNNLDKQVQAGDTTDAQAQALNIVTFVQQKAEQGTLPGTTAQIDEFIADVLCYAGLPPNTYLIQPTDNAQNLITNTGNSGVSLQAHTVSVPTLLTIDELPADSSSVLDTKLDKYPTYISITVSSQLLDSAVVAVCIPDSLGLTADVFSHLRLGHQASTGFEITQPGDPSFLGCPTSVASKSSIPGWLRKLASLVLPKPLYANTAALYAAGGVGGTTIQFSPFGAVDNSLYATGGVGGTSTQFQRMPSLNRSNPGTSAPGKASSGKSAPTAGSTTPSYSTYDANGNCISADTTLGTPLSTQCRPLITIETHNGTLFQNVPVAWAVGSNGGTIASDTLSDNGCADFASTANDSTDGHGQAGVCWTLGDTVGTDTVRATPTYGGDAPKGVIFLGASGTQETGIEFTANAVKFPATATAGSGTMEYEGTVPALPCTVTGLLTADAGTVTCTTSVPATLVPGNNVTTPVVSPPDPPKYAMTLVDGTLAVRYVQNDCFASPIYSSQPPTKSSQKIGSNLPIKCTLQTANGDAVTGATGDLTIQDRGTDGSVDGPFVFDQDSVFVQQKNKNYSYGFDTSNLTSGHYYFVTAYWNDGSTSTGWFYAK